MNDKNLLFSIHHTWILTEENNVVKVGISNEARERLGGSILFLNLPEPGTKVTSGASFGEIEGIKAVSELISPADGEVIARNEELEEDPDAVGTPPYGSWMIKVQTEVIPDGLLKAEEYEIFVRNHDKV